MKINDIKTYGEFYKIQDSNDSIFGNICKLLDPDYTILPDFGVTHKSDIWLYSRAKNRVLSEYTKQYWYERVGDTEITELEDIFDFAEDIYKYLQFPYSKMISALTKEYQMLEPFNIKLSENGEDKLVGHYSADNTRYLNLTDTHIDSETLNTTSDTTNNKNFRYAFNSVSPVATDTQEAEQTYGRTLTGSKSINKTGTNRDDNSSDNNRTINTTRDYTRTGNIGNQSNQQLIMQEFELRKKNLTNQLIDEILSVICRGKYI